MAGKAKFRVKGNFDGADEATVEIDRGTNVFTVRPLRRRQTYALPLKDVAEIVVFRVAQADAAAKRGK
jgi:hypothetical protein